MPRISKPYFPHKLISWDLLSNLKTFFSQKIFAKGTSLTKSPEGGWSHVMEYICKHFTLHFVLFSEPLCSVNNLSELILEIQEWNQKMLWSFSQRTLRVDKIKSLYILSSYPLQQ